MKNILILTLSFFSLMSLTHAQTTDGARDLVDAITLCDKATNPLTGLEQLTGNVFGEVTTTNDPATGAKIIKAQAILSLHAKNLAIMAPDVIMGTVTVNFSYAGSGFNKPLNCILTVQRK